MIVRPIAQPICRAIAVGVGTGTGGGSAPVGNPLPAFASDTTDYDYASDNRTGTIPAWQIASESLVSIDVSDNELEGEPPEVNLGLPLMEALISIKANNCGLGPMFVRMALGETVEIIEMAGNAFTDADVEAFSDCLVLTLVDLSGNAFTEAGMENLFTAFDGAGVTNCIIKTEGGTSAAPNVATLAIIASLTLAGCTVTTN